MANLDVPGGQLFYKVEGQGEPLVILRGLGRSIRYWLDYDRLLAKHFKVITIENRGIGNSQAEVSWNLTVYDLAADIVRVLDHLGIEAAHVLGVSLGGMIALAKGVRYPDRTKSIIAINSSIAGTKTLRLSMAGIYSILRYAHNADHLAEALGMVLVGRDYPAEKRRAMIEAWKEIEREQKTSLQATIKQLLAAMRFNVRKDLKKLKVPTLIVYGGDDLFVPAANSMKIHYLIPNAEIIKIDGGGHELMTDKPEELLRTTLEFVGRHSDTGRAPVLSLLDRQKP